MTSNSAAAVHPRCPDCVCPPGTCDIDPDYDCWCATCTYGCPLEDCPVCDPNGWPG